MNIKYIELNNHTGGLSRLTVIVDADKRQLSELVNKAQCDPDKYEVEIKRASKKRGLTANAYYWVLVEQLAKALMTSKDELHEEMMQRYGAFKLKDNNKPVVFSLVAGEDPKSVTKYSRSFAEGEVNGKRVVHYAVLKGSSEMTAKEFGDLLDGLISEAKDMGIETMPRNEVLALEYLNSNSPDN